MKKLLLGLILCLIIPNLVFGAAATMYVTPTGDGTKDGSSWANAFNYTNWETDVEGSAEAGDIYYVANGTYTLTSDFAAALDGNTTVPIQAIGVIYNTTTTATGTDRPLITDGAGAFTFEFDNYWVVKNFRVTGSDTASVFIGQGSLLENCYVTNDGAATRNGVNLDSAGAHVVNCDISSKNGRCVNQGNVAERLIYNYFHDSAIGVTTSASNNIEFNIFDTCKLGVVAGNNITRVCLLSNTFYYPDKAAGSIGVDVGTGGWGWVITHNIITGFENGIVFDDSSSNLGYFNYNNLYDCTTDRVNVTVGINDVDINPQFVDAANGDFDIGANLDDLGLDQPGDLSSSHLEIGAVMYEETPGTGGSCSDVFGFIE